MHVFVFVKLSESFCDKFNRKLCDKCKFCLFCKFNLFFHVELLLEKPTHHFLFHFQLFLALLSFLIELRSQLYIIQFLRPLIFCS